MTGSNERTENVRTAASLAEAVISYLGGRYSGQLGIDVDASDTEVERWFVAATLFGARISAAVAGRAFHALERAGIHRIVDAGRHDWDELVELLDAGGYTRYDYRTATRLQTLAQVVTERYGGAVAEIGRRITDPAELAAALDDLPGWGPVTVQLFLRELRGVWVGAAVDLDPLAAQAARHLGLLGTRTSDELGRIARIAAQAGYDERDLEAALVRLALAHRRITRCPGRRQCIALVAEDQSEGLRNGRDTR